MNPDKERLLRLAEREDGCPIQVGGLMNEVVRINRQWFTIPKGTAVLAPNGDRVILIEDATVFCQDTAVGVKESTTMPKATVVAEDPIEVRRRPNKGFGAV